MHTRRVYQTGKLAKRRRRIMIFRIILFIVLFVSIISGTAFWSHSDSFKINNIEIIGTNFNSIDQIENLTFDILKGNYFLGYSRSNFLLVSKGEIKNKILESSNSIKDVLVKSKGFHSLKIEVIEHSPKLSWCDEKNKCFIVNDDGIIFMEDDITGTEDLLIVRGFVQGDPIGQVYVSDEFVKSILKFTELLSQIELTVTELKTEDGDTFIFHTSDNMDLIIDKRDNVEEVFDNLIIAINQEAIHKEQFPNIEYIDLRFGNRVIYKPREW